MDVDEAIRKRRTIRRFKQDPIPQEILLELINAARCAPSGANHQPLEYIIVTAKARIDQVFEQLAWAGYVRPKRNPTADKRPVAYIIVLVNQTITPVKFGQSQDAAAAIENILLAACSKGIGTCWMGAIKRDKIRTILAVPDEYVIDSVLAIGLPDEDPIAEDAAGDSVKYYLDDDDKLHVPKRPLKAVTHVDKFAG